MKRLSTILIVAFLCSTAFAQFEAPDPSRNVPDGRVLGLGRAYIGLADGPAAVFCNPAGLARARKWSVSSMSGKFLDEFNYLSFAGLYPTSFGTFGLGFVRSAIAGSFATYQDPDSADSEPVYVIDPSASQISYSDNVLILSYGNRLSKFFNHFGWEYRMSFGANFKLFSTGLTGGPIASGEGLGSGAELDLGVLYDPYWPWLTLGLNLRNILPASLGGKLIYASGHEESYPAGLTIGAAINLIGQQDAIRRLGGHEIKLLIDYSLRPTLSQLPGTLHLGLEYLPDPILALRAGIDQDILDDGSGAKLITANNLTAGVGLNYGGFSLNYAYHLFAGRSDLSNNYFSLSYSPPEVFKAGQSKAQPIQIIEPRDKTVTFGQKILVSGRIDPKQIKSLTVNGLVPRISASGDFNSIQNLLEGKNAIVVDAVYKNKNYLYSRDIRVLRLKRFLDVPVDHPAAKPISLLAMEGLISGYPDGSFKPGGSITRAELCVILMKAKGFEGKKRSTGFKDVPAGYWASGYIAQAFSAGIVSGYPGKRFWPERKVLLVDGMVMIARFSGAKLTGQPQSKRLLTRAKAAELLYQTQAVQKVLDQGILSWHSY